MVLHWIDLIMWLGIFYIAFSIVLYPVRLFLQSIKKLFIMSVNKRRPLGKQEDIFHQAWRNRQEAKDQTPPKGKTLQTITLDELWDFEMQHKEERI